MVVCKACAAFARCGKQVPPSGWLEQIELAQKCSRRRNDDNDGTLVHGLSPLPETSSAPVSLVNLAMRSTKASRDIRQPGENKQKIPFDCP